MAKRPINPEKTKQRHDLLLVALGALLALLGSVVTSVLQERTSKAEAREAALDMRTTLAAALQTEVEANLHVLGAQFRRFENVSDPSALRIPPLVVHDTIYTSNAGGIGAIEDLALASEVVFFYTALRQLSAWSDSLPAQDALDYLADCSTLLGAGLHLQARMASLTQQRSRSLPPVKLQPDAQRLLDRTGAYRKRLGLPISQDRITFHRAAP